MRLDRMQVSLAATAAALALTGSVFAEDVDRPAFQQEHPYYLNHVPDGFIHFAKDAEAHPAAAGLPKWKGSFSTGGKTYAYKMLGGDPAKGKSTTLPVVFVPLVFTINGVVFDPTKNVNNGSSNVITLLEDSPVFTSYPISAGPTSLGNTQFHDAFMRGNFWGSAHANGYHLLLGKPTVTAALPLSIPAADGFTETVKNPPYNSTKGLVEFTYFQDALNTILSNNKIGVSPNQLVIFVYYNVFFYDRLKSSCCILGFHSTEGNFTYSAAAFNDPGMFGTAVLEDIEVIVHEIGEAMDDPTGKNLVPAYGNVGQIAGCQSNLEVGDPVTGKYTIITGTNGFKYHPEDLVFAPWFEHAKPSTSVNGWYTFLNSFTGFAKPCPPGGSN